MDLATFQNLLTDEGQRALALARKLQPTIATLMRATKQLEKQVSTLLARAALSMTLLRQRARVKFTHADEMYFTREALEQSTSETVSRHRCRRFADFARIGDFCCGIGGDLIALAEHADVVGVDCDEVRLAMAEQNLKANQCQRDVTLLNRDLETSWPTDVEAIFFDPARRTEGRRHLKGESYQPPLSMIREWRRQVSGMGIKLAPGIDPRELREYQGEVEFLSLGGELKECVLWLDDLKTCERRATVLPSGESRSTTEESPPSKVGPPLRYLYDPDPAVTRAGLVTTLAEDLRAHQISEEIAYLTSDVKVETPFAWCYEIEASMPFHLKKLRSRLRELKVGHVNLKRRGSAIGEELIKKLKLSGDQQRILVLTRCQQSPWVLICQGEH